MATSEQLGICSKHEEELIYDASATPEMGLLYCPVCLLNKAKEKGLSLEEIYVPPDKFEG